MKKTSYLLDPRPQSADSHDLEPIGRSSLDLQPKWIESPASKTRSTGHRARKTASLRSTLLWAKSIPKGSSQSGHLPGNPRFESPLDAPREYRVPNPRIAGKTPDLAHFRCGRSPHFPNLSPQRFGPVLASLRSQGRSCVHPMPNQSGPPPLRRATENSNFLTRALPRKYVR